MKTLTLSRAKEIASYWHGGLNSSLYQFASSGVLVASNKDKYLKETEDCIKQSEQSASRIGQLNVRRLKRFFVEKCKD